MQICPYKENKIGKCQQGHNFICEKDYANTCWIYHAKEAEKAKQKYKSMKQMTLDILKCLEQSNSSEASIIFKAGEMIERLDNGE